MGAALVGIVHHRAGDEIFVQNHDPLAVRRLRHSGARGHPGGGPAFAPVQFHIIADGGLPLWQQDDRHQRQRGQEQKDPLAERDHLALAKGGAGQPFAQGGGQGQPAHRHGPGFAGPDV